MTLKKPMPTGKELGEGYDLLARDARKARAGARVDRVAATQLTRAERYELDRIRKQALDAVGEAVGQRGFEFTFDTEMDLWPESKSPSDKLLFREYDGRKMRGYALVVRGWPDASTWTIQHLIVCPDQRLQGVGTRIVEAIEADALSSTESTKRILAVPVVSSHNSFWEYSGYSVERARKIHLFDKDFSVGILSKEIRS